MLTGVYQNKSKRWCKWADTENIHVMNVQDVDVILVQSYYLEYWKLL